MRKDKKSSIGVEGRTVLIPSNSMELEIQEFRESVTSGVLQPVLGALAWN